MSEEKREQEKQVPETVLEKPHSTAANADSDATVVQSLKSLESLPVTTANKEVAKPSFTATPDKFSAAQGNTLFSAASTLLNIAAQLRRPHVNIDLAKLRQNLTVEINAFNLKAKNNAIDESRITLGRYVLCAVLDEFVLDTPWGANSNWSDYSLLNTFHQDSSGGAKFFAILEKMQQAPAVNLDLLEVLYNCLCLGYLGKYRIMQGGQQQLASIKEQLYQQILAQRSKSNEAELTTLNPKVVNKVKRVPVLKLLIIALVSLLIIFTIFKLLINGASNTTMKNLRTVVIESTVTPDGQRVAK